MNVWLVCRTWSKGKGLAEYPATAVWPQTSQKPLHFFCKWLDGGASEGAKQLEACIELVPRFTVPYRRCHLSAGGPGADSHGRLWIWAEGL